MTTITVKQDISEYKLTEDLELVCTHIDHTIEPPCCDGSDCGCRGLHSVVCNNQSCTGLTDSDVDELMENYFDSQEREHDEY